MTHVCESPSHSSNRTRSSTSGWCRSSGKPSWSPIAIRRCIKIVPSDEKDAPDLAALRGTLVIFDDPLEPVSEDWEAAE